MTMTLHYTYLVYTKVVRIFKTCLYLFYRRLSIEIIWIKYNGHFFPSNH